MSDNVKKVFEMLGVEPNEKFKIGGTNSVYYYDENLVLRFENGNPSVDVLTRFFVGDIEIIKLPKEPTFIELMNWKPKVNEEYHYVDSCNHVKTNKNECWVIDEQIIEHNKPYPTREMAERRKDIKEKYQSLGYKFTIQEWQNSKIKKYGLYIDHNLRQVRAMCHKQTQESKYMFKNIELYKEFIKFLGSTQQEQYEAACLYL